jgi:hypothetical protein
MKIPPAEHRHSITLLTWKESLLAAIFKVKPKSVLADSERIDLVL